jgi:hypothetical protein
MRDWALAVSTAVGVAGLIGIAVSPELRIWYVIIVVLILVCFSVAILVTKVLNFFRTVKTSISNREIASTFAVHPRGFWDPKIRKESEFEYERLEIRVEYDDPEGKVITFIKKQEIIARTPGIMEIWDVALRSDGKIDWSTFRSSIGRARPDRKKPVAGTWEVPTELDKALPLNQITHREVTCKMSEAFREDEENLGLWITYQTHHAGLSVKLCNNQEITEVRGFVTFGGFRTDEITQPTKVSKCEATWNIFEPQIGEKYILVWSIKR